MIGSNQWILDLENLYIRKLQINGIARYYVSGEETSINLNMLVNRSIEIPREEQK